MGLGLKRFEQALDVGGLAHKWRRVSHVEAGWERWD